jgi:transcriptional regulator with XRE-family HTH domain
MAKRSRSYLPATRDAVTVLGTQIAIARRELGWSAAELAERLGVSRPLVSRLENGHPTTQIGTVFEAAVLCGIPLFATDPSDLGRLAEGERRRVALLPARVHSAPVELDDDF